jgi:hypothetical protein
MQPLDILYLPLQKWADAPLRMCGSSSEYHVT